MKIKKKSAKVYPKSVNDPEETSGRGNDFVEKSEPGKDSEEKVQPRNNSEETSKTEKDSEETSKNKTMSGGQDIVLEDYNGKMTGRLQTLNSKNFPNDDNFGWVKTGRRVKKNEFQLYKCNVDNCTGRKKCRNISPPKRNKINLKNGNNVCREVYYLQEHTCPEEQVKVGMENSSEAFENSQNDDKEIDAESETAKSTEMPLGKG